MTLDVRAAATTFADGHRLEVRPDAWGQLIYAAEGVMRVKAGERLWIVPPTRAVWAPPRTTYEIFAHGALATRTLYLSPRLSTPLADEFQGMDVRPLLREIILHVIGVGTLDRAQASQRRVIGVLLDQLRATGPLPLSIKLPSDRRARLVADRLQKNPADRAALDSLGRVASASARTLQRLFLDETGLRFSAWRQRLRMLHAVARLGAGESVTIAGKRAGYATTSAFIAAFRKQLGSTPLRFRCAAPQDCRSAD
ncbi:MAG TPA: helix-turn-helix transcriptional regulator [Gammaproteobacteria bacterium]|nr:helix-turn-helix transcriptional regulator [Gammaproteobacteria bacterium]